MQSTHRTVLVYIAILLSISAFSVSVYMLVNKPTIAYVRSHDLVYEYEGMKEAQIKYQQQIQTWQANIDTLQSDYKRSIASIDKTKDAEFLLQQQKIHLEQYTRAVQSKAKEEDEKITQSVLNQINTFVEEYGKAHNYDIILGTTASGSILYGIEAMDITKEVLQALNKHYQGGNLN